MTKTPRLTYLYDPLCGWCYGASPMLNMLIAREYSFALLPTGLFTGSGAFAMNDGFATYAWEADQRIAHLSGQPFSDEYRVNVLGNQESRVDSDPATLALTAVRLAAPEEEFRALGAIQRARYVDGRDNGSAGVISDILAALELPEAAELFKARDASLLSANQTRIAEGRAEMQRFGARGVPALIAEIGNGRRMLNSSALYGGEEQLLAELEAA